VHCREAETGIHAPAIDVHGARTALAMIASLFRSGQMKMLSQAIEKRGARIDPHFIVLAIHPQCDRDGIRFKPFRSVVLIEHPNLAVLTLNYVLELRQVILTRNGELFLESTAA